jgi:hypothetical protein
MSENLVEQTLAALEKAQTQGILTATGIYGYDLGELIRLIPVVTPFRDKVARVTPTDGAEFAIWRSLMNVNQSQPRPNPGVERAGSMVNFSLQNFQAQYRPYALDTTVSQDSYYFAKGYDDPYAEATVGLLNQLLIGEDKTLIGGQSFALPTPAAPTLVPATTGGSIGAVTVYVAVAVRTASGYYYGGNSQGSKANTSALTGTTNTVTATIPAVKGGFAYDWFVNSSGGADGTYVYAGTTTTGSFLFKSIPGAAANPNANPQAQPLLSNWAPTLNTAADNGSAPLNADSSPIEVDGLLATLTADYTATGTWVAAGTGTPNPAAFIDNGGAVLTATHGTVDQFSTLFGYIWNQCFASPSALMVNSITAQKIADLILASPGAVTYINTDADGRINITAGGHVGQVINAVAGGVQVPIEVHPHVPPGTVIARTDSVPFSNANITNVLEVRTLQDFMQFDYAASRGTGANGGPRKDTEIRAIEAFVNRAPVTMGLLTNIG